MTDPNLPRPRRGLPPLEDESGKGTGDLYGPVFRPARAFGPEAPPEAGPSRPGPGAEPAASSGRGHDRGSLRRSIGLTVASTVIPGSGLLGARSIAAKVTGAVVPLLFIGVLVVIWYSASSNLGNFAGFAVDPGQLRVLSLVLVAVGLVWVALIAGTHLLTRPKRLAVSRKAVGAVAVTICSLVVAAPLAVSARYAFDQQQLVETVFADETEVTSTSRPSIDSREENPWEGHPRVNILLLGADGNEVRDEQWGIRTDTIMLASIDTTTGDTDIIQIPRNVQYVPFPEGSEMARWFPEGFRGEGDSANWFVNNIWHTVEGGDYPDILADQTYRGAEALKQGVEGITGLKVDYFALLNIDGIQALINAMGGVTVNINERLPMGRDTYNGPTGGWLEPGPDQHLNGYEAMWYARSRSGSSDYDRMARQSCLVDAIIRQANPTTMLTSYEAIASASAKMVMTDIPQQVLEPLVSLSLVVKDADIERLVFTPGKNGYDFNNPDFDAMRAAVQDAIAPEADPSSSPTATSQPTVSTSPTQTAEPSPDPSVDPSESPTFVEGSQSVADACAYNGD